MIPHAKLQPIAPINIVRISAWPLSAADRAPVNVRTMMSPNRISESRSPGSTTRNPVPFASGAGLAADVTLLGVFRDEPSLVGIESRDVGSELRGLGSQVLLVDVAVVVDHERLHARHAVV